MFAFCSRLSCQSRVTHQKTCCCGLHFNGKLTMRAEDNTVVDYAVGWGTLDTKEPFMSKPNPGNWKQITELELEWKKRKGWA